MNICTVSVLVDTQAPRVDRCRSPPAFTRRTADESSTMLVTWEEPLFSDNSHGPVTVTQSHRGPPADLPVGTTHVHYTATDRYRNNATCVVDIVVQGRHSLLIMVALCNRETIYIFIL